MTKCCLCVCVGPLLTLECLPSPWFFCLLFLEKVSKLGIEALHINIIKAIYVKPTENNLRNGAMRKAFL